MRSFAVSLYTIISLIEHICCNSGTREYRLSFDLCFLALARDIIMFYVLPLFMLRLLWPIFVRSLLRRFHSNQLQDPPLAKDSLGVYISLSGTYCRWLDHSLIRCVNGLSISLSVSCMKQPLYFIRFFGTVWPCSGCLVLLTCYSISSCATPLILMAWGAIPACRYKR